MCEAVGDEDVVGDEDAGKGNWRARLVSVTEY